MLGSEPIVAFTADAGTSTRRSSGPAVCSTAPRGPITDDASADATGTTTLYFVDSAGAVTNLLAGASDEAIQDLAGGMWTGNTETLIVVTYQDADGTIDAVVTADLGDAGWNWTNVTDADITNTLTSSIFVGSGSSTNAVDLATAEVSGTLPVGNIADQYIRNDTDDITTGSITLDDGTGDSPALVLKDASDVTFTVTKVDASSPAIGNVTFVSAGALQIKHGDGGPGYFQFVTPIVGNVPTFSAVGANMNITADDGDISFSNENLSTTGTLAAGVTTVTGVINTSVGFDGVGAVDLDYGSGDITDHTFDTDGSGTAEFVIPTGGIDSTEILDNTILEVDLKAVDASADEDILTKEDTTGDFEWHSFLQIAAAQTGAVDFGGATSTEIANAADVSANITDGMISWDSDDDTLYIGDGTNVIAIGGGSETVNEFHVNFVVPSTPFSSFAAIDIEIDDSAMVATSEVHGINIAVVGGSPGKIVALGTHGPVEPIHQHVGTFVTPDQAAPDAEAGEIPSGGSWSDGIDGNTLFEADDDEIYIGAAAVFGDREVILGTPSSAHISQSGGIVIEYQHTDTTWDSFIPLDGTEGFRQSGIIEWTAANLTNWKSDSDPGGANTAAGYWIRIRRTRNSIGTDAIATTVKTLDPTEFGWDENADLIVNDITAATVTVSDTLEIPAAEGSATLTALGQMAINGAADGISVHLRCSRCLYLREHDFQRQEGRRRGCLSQWQ